jgi:hypothetical protein
MRVSQKVESAAIHRGSTVRRTSLTRLTRMLTVQSRLRDHSRSESSHEPLDPEWLRLGW